MNKFKRWIGTITSLIAYPSIIRNIEKSNSEIIFIFPHFQTGGGERVHAEIMQSVSEKRPLCLISYFSYNKDMKAEFEKYSDLVDLQRWGWKQSMRETMIKKIADIINKKDKAIVFGCGNHFFYDLVPLLNSEVKVIDLMHNFSGHDPKWFEQYSLPNVHLFQKRIVLGERHKKQLIQFYKKNHIPNELSNRIEVIHNKIKTPDNIIKKELGDVIEILFVARNGWEKRVSLFVDITKECFLKNLPIKFTMIGDFESFSSLVNSNVTITGRITNQLELSNYYQKAHYIMITSEIEGFPMVLLEGMAKGVVPISTDVGVISDFVNEEYKTGFIIENSKDTEKLKNLFVQKLEKIINQQENYHEMSISVQSLVRKEFSEEKFIEKYKEILSI